MARPPIIISNAGIIDILAKDCGNENSDQGVANKIKNNINDLNDPNTPNTPVTMILKNKNGHGDTPCLYWRLTTDDPFKQGNKNLEGASINDVVDETD